MDSSITNIADLMSQVDEANETDSFNEYFIDAIQPDPNQPRKDIDEKTLNQLADTIKEHGVLQPIVIRQVDEGYIIIAGERRWRASQIAGLTKIPAILRDVSEESLLAIQLIENLQRDSMLPLDEALAIEKMIKEFELSGSEIASAIGKTPAYVSLRRKLLKLPPVILTLAEEGTSRDAELLCLLGDFWKLNPERAGYYIENPELMNRTTLRGEVKEAKDAKKKTKEEDDNDHKDQLDILGGNSDLDKETNLVEGSDLVEETNLVEGSDLVEETNLVEGSDLVEETNLVEGSDLDEETNLVEGSDLDEENKRIAVNSLSFIVVLINDLTGQKSTGSLIVDQETPTGHIWVSEEDGERLYNCEDYTVSMKGAAKGG